MDMAVSAIDVCNYEPTASGGIVEAGGPAPGASWAADDSYVYRSRRRLFVRAQSRKTQLRFGACRLSRRYLPARLPPLLVSDTEHSPRLCPRFSAIAGQLAQSLAETADRWPGRRGSVSVVELGIGDRSAAGRDERLAALRRRK